MLSLKTIRVSAAVKVFMMMPNDFGSISEQFHRSHDLCADDWMPSHLRHLCSIQAGWLEDDLPTHTNFTDVMQHARELDLPHLRLREPHCPSDPHRDIGGNSSMSACICVLEINGVRNHSEAGEENVPLVAKLLKWVVCFHY